MSERVAVQDEISRSATTYPLDQRIDRYQSIHWTLRSGTGSVISQRPSARSLLWGNAMKKMTAPIPFDGSQLDQTRHISAFFNSADEEYRVLLPGGCFGRSDLRNARKVGFSASSVEVSEKPVFCQRDPTLTLAVTVIMLLCRKPRNPEMLLKESARSRHAEYPG